MVLSIYILNVVYYYGFIERTNICNEIADADISWKNEK